MSETNATTILYRIRKYDPARDAARAGRTSTIPRLAGMTVLDGLWTIKETLDPSLSWRSSCRMGCAAPAGC